MSNENNNVQPGGNVNGKNFSYDDIRRQFQNSPSKSEQGTSSDGKVRRRRSKRKRRSYQPVHRIRELNRQRRKKIIIGVLAMLFVIAIVLGIFYYYFIAKVQSQEFATKLSNRLNQITQADCRVSPLKINKNSIGINFINIENIPINYLKSLELNKVILGVTTKTYFSKDWEVSHISCGSATMFVKLGEQNPLSDGSNNAFPLMPMLQSAGFNMGLNISPNNITFNKISLNDVTVNVDGREIITGARIRTKYSGEEKYLIKEGNFNQNLHELEYIISNANFTMPKLNGFVIQNSGFRYLGGKVYLEDGKIKSPTNDYGEFSAVINENANSEATASIKANFKNFSIKNLFKKSEDQRFIGSLAIKFEVLYNAVSKTAKYSANISNGNIALSRTGIQEQFTLSSGVDFNKIHLRNFVANIKKNADKTNIENISADSENFRIIASNITINNDSSISGKINFAIHQKHLRGASDVFLAYLKKNGTKKGAWYSLSTELSGTTKNPETDLESKFSADMLMP